MKQARIEWQGQVRDVLVDERDQVRLHDGTVLKELSAKPRVKWRRKRRRTISLATRWLTM